MRIVVLGMNHRSAPLELRERLAVEDVEPLLKKLVAGDAIEEAVLFSTCNRVEVVALTRRLEAARHRLRAFFRRELAGDAALPAELDSHLYEHLDSDAMCHVLRVASALDSMVVGEPQILGQTKEAYRRAAECGASGPILSRLFQHAFATAKRVRSETRIAERPVSVASVAVDLARQIFEDLEAKQALLIGAGEMIELALRRLKDEGLAHVAVANRTPERAALLAAELGASAHGLDELPALLRESDLVLTSIGSEGPLLDHAQVSAALRDRPHRPLFVIDIGVPRNVDPEVDRIENVYLYDIDDLASLARENAAERRSETARAEAIVAAEQQRFDGWFAALRAVPTIRHLRARAEAIRAAELSKLCRRMTLSDADREALEALTHAIVNKLLHAPLARLRREAEGEAGMAYLEVARALFGLDEPAAGEQGDSPDEPDPE